jgi:hypothetical protein
MRKPLHDIIARGDRFNNQKIKFMSNRDFDPYYKVIVWSSPEDYVI